VVAFDATDIEWPVAFNPIGNIHSEKRALVTAGIVASFRHIWRDSWGHRTEQIIRNAAATLMDNPGSTLVMLPRLLTDEEFRRRAVGRVGDPLTTCDFRGVAVVAFCNHRCGWNEWSSGSASRGW
jgi:hypothetical protein